MNSLCFGETLHIHSSALLQAYKIPTNLQPQHTKSGCKLKTTREQINVCAHRC